MNYSDDQALKDSIAIVGMSCRLPGANDPNAFWRNLCDGVESISFFSDDEIDREAVDKAELNDPKYVKARGILDNIEEFDAGFFGFNPREAELTDPQHRLFLECCWEALESAGCDPEQYRGVIGVYGGAGANTYLLFHLGSAGYLSGSAQTFQAFLYNKNDHLTSRVAYKLNLRGPSVTVQTACSTSLVAVGMACQSLLNYQIDVALAGGASIIVPQRVGYLYHEHGIASPDGHCRAFDARAQGTVGGNGVGIVVLKRLADALTDGDSILALIRGSAINNDGSLKTGYTAPSADSQTELIALAQGLAGVEPETITYIETHGTGTPLGDPIEVLALTRAFRRQTQKKNFCALGSVKASIGHLDTAAGVAGLIKTVLMLQHRMIPASLNFEQPSPQIDLANSPFYVNTRLRRWETQGVPRRAGVSSFGIGGTNAHAVLEEAPPRRESGPSRPYQLLLLSARSAAKLDAACANLIGFLKQNPSVKLADVAHTLRVGRKTFVHRRMLVCSDVADAAATLEALDPERVFTRLQEPANRPLTFMFPGQGTQHIRMAAQLYSVEPVFRQHVDHCADRLANHLGFHLTELLYPSEAQAAEMAEKLNQTRFTQPALFVIEYALARLWMAWGVRPQAMIGHSLGEYVAACLAEVFSLEEALALVTARAQLMQGLPGGAMLALALPENRARALLGKELSLAAVNSPSQCVVSGTSDAIDQLQQYLDSEGVVCHRLQTSHAFHSRMMEPIREPFYEQVSRVRLGAPKIPFISNVSGTWITKAEATDPGYWVKHMCQTVEFSRGLEVLLKEPEAILLEVGPGQGLRNLARWHPNKQPRQLMLTSLPRPAEPSSDTSALLKALGHLWLADCKPDWLAFNAHEERHCLPLPTYPFDRQRYWVDFRRRANANESSAGQRKNPKVADWFYLPAWKEACLALSGRAAALSAEKKNWLIFADPGGLAHRLAEQLNRHGQHAVCVQPGQEFRTCSEDLIELDPRRRQDYQSLVRELQSRNRLPDTVAHFWTVTGADPEPISRPSLPDTLDQGFFSLLFLAQALGHQNVIAPVKIIVVSDRLRQVNDGDPLCPEKATVLGPCLVIPREYPNLSCCSIDIARPPDGSWQEQRLVEQLLHEMILKRPEPVVALRGGRRWLQTFEPMRLEGDNERPAAIRAGGTYLITGGLGGLGLEVADYLAQTAGANLVLVSRSGLPDRGEWEGWLQASGNQDAVSQQVAGVLKLEAHGSQVMICRADVTDEQQMGQVVASAVQRFGAIHGVVHAAGIASGRMIQLKDAEEVAAVLAPKVKGAQVLERLFKDLPLDFFVLFSSLSSVVGRLGQVDYTAANAFLDAFAGHLHAQTGGLVTSINWGRWEEVGMAVDRRGPQSEATKPARRLDHPFLDQVIIEAPGREVYVTQLNVERHWILDEHRIIGYPVLPGVSFFEMVRAALGERARGRVLEFNDVFFLSPLRVKDGETRELRLLLETEGDQFNFKVRSYAEEAGDAASLADYAVGKVKLYDRNGSVRHDVQALRDRCNLEEILAPEEDREDNVGPRWQSVQRVHLGRNEMLMLLEMPEVFAADFEHLKFHPALLDRAAGTAKRFLASQGAHLPFGYKRLKILGDMPRKIYAFARFKEEESPSRETINFDLVLMDEQGEAVVDIEGFSQKQVNDLALKLRALAQVPEARDSGALNPATAGDVLATEPQRGDEDSSADDDEGIRPGEGVEAFRRILQARLAPQVSVCPRDLQWVIQQADAVARRRVMQAVAGQPAAAPSRPQTDLGHPYVAPETEIERRIAKVWKEVLGVDRVGLSDSFFDLGGNSLFAIQVIAKLQKELNMEIPPAIIFEGATVEALARLISQNGQPTPSHQQRQSRGERRQSRVQERRKSKTALQHEGAD